MGKYRRELLMLGVAAVVMVVYFGANYFGRLLPKVYSNLGFAFESAIPLIPAMVPLYLTVYFVYLAPFFFVFNRHKYARVMQAYLFVVLVSGLIYITLPTKVTWPPFVAKSTVDCFIVFLRNMDVPYCAIPSMHVSLAFLATFVVASENKKWGYVIAVAATLITFSTLFTKQHYLLDLVAGFVLSVIAYRFFVHQKSVLHYPSD